ncbi:MAG: TonB-dependent receptor, partial [Acidobacteria bacterium]|nr:TonB-dependent receptor [Acidobacteriota bacterium]
VLDARNYFDPEEDKHKYIRNQFGFGLSGPVVRDQTYFFFSGDFLRERLGLRRLGTVPTELQRQGNLSELEGPIYDPFTRMPFEGNIIPDERLSPIALGLLDTFPDPTQPGLSNNYLGHPVYRDRQDQLNVRVDHRLTGRDELALRYSYGYKDLYEPYSEDMASLPGFGDFVKDRGHSATIQYKRVLGAGAVNSLLFGFNRLERNLMSENSGTDVGQELGVDWLDLDPRRYGYPSITIAGYSKIGDATNLPILRAADTYQAADDISFIRGRHMFKAGAEVRRLELDSILDLLVRGSLSFSGALSGSGISDFLLGYPSFGLQAQADNPIMMRSTAIDFYFQDEWKPHPRLALNLGLRYEYNTPPVDPDDRMSTLNPETGEIVQVGTGGVSRSGISPDSNNFAPRFGFAWSLDEKTVMRGGYGLYYDSGMLQVNTAQYFNPPLFNLRVFFPSAEGLPTLEDPFPSTGGLTPPPSLSVLSPDMVSSYVQHWNLNMQRSFGSGGAFSLAYAGSKGTRLVRSRDINQPAPAEGYIQFRRPYPAYGNILLVESGADSSYHSLQAGFNYPMFRGLSLWTAYTFSKSIDSASSFLGNRADPNFPQNSSNPGAERALSSFDTPHRFVLAYVYALPGNGRWTRNTEFQGIVTLQSGHPCTPVLRFDNSNTGNTGQASGLDRPNVIGSFGLSDPTPERWFDAGAFEIPAPFTFGNAGRNIIRGPGYASVDVSLSRRIAVSEKVDMKLEAQAFNLLNRTNFDLPELNADDPGTFGRILSAKAARQIQFALRLSF